MTKKRTIAVIDCETDPFKRGRIPAPFIWGFYNGETYEEFTNFNEVPSTKLLKDMRDTSELIPYLQSQDIIVYAHNGGKFDYHFLLPHLEPFSEITIIAGRLAKFKIGQCEFRDSYNLFPVPMSAWQKQPFDYDLMERAERYKPDNWYKIRDYLYSDCVSLYDMTMKFIERSGIVITQASASMKEWQAMTQEKAPKSDQYFYEKFHNFYYGGRTECFGSGLIDYQFYVVDINSAYPFAMLHSHPFSLEYVETDGNIGLSREDWGPCFFHVRARSRGAFPLRDKDKSLYFPVTDIIQDYFITGWELLAALETNTVSDVRIIKSYRFLELRDFKDFIHGLYDQRRIAKAAGDKATDLLAKLAMNSLYGKFAADPSRYKEYMIVPPELVSSIPLDGDDEGFKPGGFFGSWGLGYRDLPEDRQRYYNVATAASITGFVRAYLWRNICKCSGVLYCDTDSIVAREVDEIELGPELGKWELEGTFDKGGIGGKKLYAFHYKRGTGPKVKNKEGKRQRKTWKIASKGARLTPQEIMKVAAGGTVEYEPEVPTFSVHSSEPVFTKRKISATVKKR